MSHALLPKAEDLGAGHWPDILRRAGMDAAFLTGRPGPCPVCPGGTDRYQWSYKKDCYVCRRCTGGYRSGLDLLIRFTGWSFREAADYVRACFHIGHTQAVALAPKPLPGPYTFALEEADVEAGRARMERVWRGAVPVQAGDPVDRYLRRRVPGLRELPPQIRFHPRLAYYEPAPQPGARPDLVGHFPAMLLRGLDAEGKLVQLHKTFLTPDGYKAALAHPKKTDRGVGSNSYALRLQDPAGDTLGVCEGIETALAASVLDGTVVWPCHSAGVLANFVLPVHLRGQVRRLVIYADHDEVKAGKRAGSHAAAQCAQRQRRDGLRTLIVRPAKANTDMADFVQASAMT